MRRSVEFAVIAALMVSGCSSILTSNAPPDTTYWLKPASISPVPDSDAAGPSIQVAVSAAPGLDVDRVLVRGPGATLNSYTAARWPDSIPDVVETLVRTALEDSGRFDRVTAARAGIRSDWNLDLEVRAFYALVSGTSAPPDIEFAGRGYLKCPGRVLPVRILARQGARANTMTEITAAFQSVVDEGLDDLIKQLPPTCVDATQ